MADHGSFCDAKGICFALQEKTSPAERRERESSFYEKDGVWHCLLVAGEGMDEGVLVESEGSAYARYSAFVPFAQEIIRQYQDMQETQTDVMQMKM